jgi:hypothetical protein
LCVMKISQADRCQGCPRALEFFFVCAQLRDVLAAENSTIVPQKHHHRPSVLPKRTELHVTPVRIG